MKCGNDARAHIHIPCQIVDVACTRAVEWNSRRANVRTLCRAVLSANTLHYDCAGALWVHCTSYASELWTLNTDNSDDVNNDNNRRMCVGCWVCKCVCVCVYCTVYVLIKWNNFELLFVSVFLLVFLVCAACHAPERDGPEREKMRGTEQMRMNKSNERRIHVSPYLRTKSISCIWRCPLLMVMLMSMVMVSVCMYVCVCATTRTNVFVLGSSKIQWTISTERQRAGLTNHHHMHGAH